MEAFLTIFSPENLHRLLDIIVIDLVLAGDNAVVISLAVRNLPDKQRKMGILLGAGAAVVLRVALTFFASQLLLHSYIKLVGGLLIFWIAVKLLSEDGDHEEGGKESKNLREAITTIMIADIVMSLDNILAVAGASQGHFGLLLFGLGLSIPFVVFSSNLLSNLMKKYPVIIVIGGAILGKVGAEMIMTDPVVANYLHVTKPMLYAAEAVGVVAVVALGWLVKKRRGAKA